MTSTFVYAKDIYYTNTQNVNMTKGEYNKLLSIFGKSLVESISQDDFDILVNEEYTSVVKSTKYYIDTTIENEETYYSLFYEFKFLIFYEFIFLLIMLNIFDIHLLIK